MGERKTEESGVGKDEGAEGIAGPVKEGDNQKLQDKTSSADAGGRMLEEAEMPPGIEDHDALERRASMELESLKKVIREKEAVIHDYEDLLKRIQAEFDNYRKRVEREREEFGKFVNERIIRKLITVVDDMDRGLSDSSGNGGYDAFRVGMEKIRNNTMQLLVEEGVKEIPTSGKFDPYYHEALVVEENPDCDDDAIVEVYQKGFTLGGKVLRPAKVRVSKNPQKRDEGDKEKSEI